VYDFLTLFEVAMGEMWDKHAEKDPETKRPSVLVEAVELVLEEGKGAGNKLIFRFDSKLPEKIYPRLKFPEKLNLPQTASRCRDSSSPSVGGVKTRSRWCRGK
jgi:hypothetical protein